MTETQIFDTMPEGAVRVTYRRSYLVRCEQTWTADINVEELSEDAREALRDGYFHPELDEAITEGGDPDREDYSDVDDWMLDGTITCCGETV